MDLLKKIILSFLILSITINVYGNQVSYTMTNYDWNYEIWETDSTYLNYLPSGSPLLNDGGPFTQGVEIPITYSSTSQYGGIFFLPYNTEDYLFRKGQFKTDFSGPQAYSPIPFEKYTPTELPLTSGQCKPTIPTAPTCVGGVCTLKVNSNLDPLKAGGNLVTYLSQPVHEVNTNPIEHLLKKYYYMKAQAKVSLYKYGGGSTVSVEEFFPSEAIPISAVPKLDGIHYTNYVLLKPGNNQFNFNLPTNEEIYGKYGTGKYFWQYTITPVDLKCDVGIQDNVLDIGSEIVIGNWDVQVPQLPGMRLTGTKISYDDSITRKVVYDYNTNKTSFVGSVFQLPSTTPNAIKVFENNVLVRNEIIDPKVIALNLHKITNLRNVTQVKNEVDEIYTLMNKLEIEKHLDKSVPGKTRIKIKLNIPDVSDRQDITIYQVIPKSVLSDFSQLNVTNNGGGQFFINDKDPVIGWYFNDSNGGEEIEYEMPNFNEGGVIIIAQEPILFNEGDLIVNYREGSCSVGEADLFGLDDLYETGVKKVGGFYRVCVAHRTEDLTTGTLNNYKHIFNYIDNGNMSFTQALTDSVDISVDNSTPMYWNVIVQKENPTGDYSCLGSFENEVSSLFGDCGYIEDNRIWLHLGDDVAPPTTTLSYPSVAHTLRVTLSADDGFGTGVKETRYCIEDEDILECTNKGTYKIYSGMFVVSCPNAWGCEKTIKFYSVDNANNEEVINSQVLNLIDEGSSCESSCLGRPSPNRYLSSCNNLNGCNFYDINASGVNDDGAQVATLCNMLTENAWAKYNQTHDIKCPNGPFAMTALSADTLDFSQSECDSIRVDRYNVFINGESVIMKIAICDVQ